MDEGMSALSETSTVQSGMCEASILDLVSQSFGAEAEMFLWSFW